MYIMGYHAVKSQLNVNCLQFLCKSVNFIEIEVYLDKILMCLFQIRNSLISCIDLDIAIDPIDVSNFFCLLTGM